MESIVFRFASAEDLNACLAFDSKITEDMMLHKISNYEILVAEKNSQIISYLKLQYLWDNKPFISLILVDESCRGKGIGRGLLSYLVDFLKLNGFDSVLSSSQVNEIEPQEWHRKMGFQECGIINGLNECGYGELFFKLYIE